MLKCKRLKHAVGFLDKFGKGKVIHIDFNCEYCIIHVQYPSGKIRRYKRYE